jgi:vacuolar-type H+-ATPase subunit I/STV1
MRFRFLSDDAIKKSTRRVKKLSPIDDVFDRVDQLYYSTKGLKNEIAKLTKYIIDTTPSYVKDTTPVSLEDDKQIDECAKIDEIDNDHSDVEYAIDECDAVQSFEVHNASKFIDINDIFETWNMEIFERGSDFDEELKSSALDNLGDEFPTWTLS